MRALHTGHFRQQWHGRWWNEAEGLLEGQRQIAQFRRTMQPGQYRTRGSNLCIPGCGPPGWWCDVAKRGQVGFLIYESLRLEKLYLRGNDVNRSCAVPGLRQADPGIRTSAYRLRRRCTP